MCSVLRVTGIRTLVSGIRRGRGRKKAARKVRTQTSVQCGQDWKVRDDSVRIPQTLTEPVCSLYNVVKALDQQD